MRKKPDSLCTSKMIFALSLGLCFLGITSALTIPNQNAEHKPFFEGIKIVVSGDNNNEMIEKTGENNILRFSNGIATKGKIQDYPSGSYASLFGGSDNEMVKSATAVIFGGGKNKILTGGDKAYIIGGDTQKIQTTDPTYYIGGKNNGVTADQSNNDHGMFIGGQNNEYIGENKNYISIIANNDKKVTKENSLLIHNTTTNETTIKNTFFYNNQENNAKNDNAAEFYSENGLQINTASSVSGITINAGGSFQMVPKDINDKNNLIKKPESCNANNNGLYEVVNSGGDICVFYCNGHDWKDAFPGEVRYTGTNGNIETRSDQRKCNEWPTTKSKGDCVISGGMTIANGMTAELYKGDYPKCEKFIGTCKNGKIQDEDKEDVNAKQLRHICEAATGRCQATTEQREKQLIDENAIPCSGINFTTPGNKAIVLTGQCPSSNTMNTKYTNECLYTCKEGYKPYDSGSGTKCEEVFKIVFTGTSVTTGEIIFAGRKEAKNFIYSGQTRTGYTFTGWKNFSTTDAINTKGKFKRKGDVSINGGTEVDSGNVEYYYNTMGDFDEKYHLTGEYTLTLSGLWEPNTYTINFSGNGGVFQDKKSNGSITCNYDNIQYNYDDLYRLTSTPSLHCDISAYNTPTKTGYTFIGWEITGLTGGVKHEFYSGTRCNTLLAETQPETTGYNDFDTIDGTNIQCVKNLTAQKNGSITFIAHWRPNKLIVNYYGNGADYAYVKGNDWTQFPDSYHVPIIKKQDLIPEENNYHKIPNPQTGYYDSPISKSYPYDYRTWSFSLTRSGFQGSGTYDVYLGTTKVATIYQDIAKFKERDEIYVQEFAKEINVLSALEKGDVTVSLYAGWEPCHAGSYCPANQEPQKCTAGMTSAPGAYKIEQCYTKEPCSKGRYLPAKSGTCAQCENGYYCPNEKKYYYSGSNDQGKNSCVAATNSSLYTGSDGNRTTINNCYMNIPCGSYKVNNKIQPCGSYRWSTGGISHYNNTNELTSCNSISYNKSPFGYWANSSCKKETCTNWKPANSHYSTNGTNNDCAWECDSGYHPYNGTCVQNPQCGTKKDSCTVGNVCYNGNNSWYCLGADESNYDVKCKYTPEYTNTVTSEETCGARRNGQCISGPDGTCPGYKGTNTPCTNSENECCYIHSSTYSVPASVSQVSVGSYSCNTYRLNFRINGHHPGEYEQNGNVTHVNHVVVNKGQAVGYTDLDNGNNANDLNVLWNRSIQGYTFLGWYTSPQYNASLGELAGQSGFVDTNNQQKGITNAQITRDTIANRSISRKYNNVINLYAWREIPTEKKRVKEEQSYRYSETECPMTLPAASENLLCNNIDEIRYLSHQNLGNCGAYYANHGYCCAKAVCKRVPIR